MTPTSTRDRRNYTIAGVVLTIVLFLAANVFFTTAVKTVRLDLTENALFTLSPGTTEVLKAIDEPIALRYFVSKQLTQGNPLYARYSERVRELLTAYEKIAAGKLKVEIFNPEPYSREEDRAVAAGLQGVPFSQEGELVYFGLVGNNSTDDNDKIAFLTPERENFIEYDLTRLIFNLSNPKKRVVGVVTSLPIQGGPQSQYRPWVVYEQMEQFFKVKVIQTGARKIDDDVDILMLAQIDDIGTDTLYAIDQFLMKGGRAIVFADPHLETPTGRRPMMPGMPALSNPGFDKFWPAWGVTFRNDSVIGDALTSHRVNFPQGDRTLVVNYLPWLGLREDRINSTDVITSQVQILNMTSAGHFELAAGSTAKLEPLVSSSPQAMEIEAMKVSFRPNPLALIEEFKPTGKNYVLAGRLTGTIKSAFPDGPPLPEKPKDEPKDDAAKKRADDEFAKAMAEYEKLKGSHLVEPKGPVNMILVADADMLANESWVRTQDMFNQQVAVPIANNGDFVLNALDNLTGSGSVIGLRSRGLSNRPFLMVEQIRAEAELKYRSKERELDKNLREIERKIKEVRTDPESGTAVLTGEQRKSLDQFRAEMLSIRTELREVQHALRSDIERLDGVLKAINIALMPLLIAAIAVGLWVTRRVRYSRRFETT